MASLLLKPNFSFKKIYIIVIYSIYKIKKNREQPWPSGYGRWACREVQGLNPKKVIGGVRKGIQP